MKSFEIKNYDEWKDIIKKKGGPSKVSRDTGVAYSVVNNSIKPINLKTGQKPSKLSSKNIEKILNFYNDINPKDVGIIVIEMPIYSQRIYELRKRKNLTQKDLACKLNISDKSVISNWEKGIYRPTEQNFIELAKYFNVSLFYIKGEIEYKKADSEMIGKETGLSEEAINISKSYKNINIYGKEQHKVIKNDLGFDYSDIENFLITDRQLFDIFYLEAVRVIQYYTNPNVEQEFEELFNEGEIGGDLFEGIGENFTHTHSMPYKVDIKTISKAVLSKKISMTFDDFIDKIMVQNKINKCYKNNLLFRELELKKELELIQKLKNTK